MSHRATLQLDPNADAGLTITAQVYDAANALADAIDCVETGTGTARYSGTSDTSLTDGTYDVAFFDAAGTLRGNGNLFISGGQEIGPNVNVVAVNGVSPVALKDPRTLAQDISGSLAGASNIVVMGIVQGLVIEIVRGDAYDDLADTRRNLTLTRLAGEPWPDDLTGHTIRFTANRSTANRATGSQTGQATITFDGSIVVATESGDLAQEVVFRPTSAQTSQFAIGVGNQGYEWDAVAIKSGKQKRLRAGVVNVRENQTPLA